MFPHVTRSCQGVVFHQFSQFVGRLLRTKSRWSLTASSLFSSTPHSYDFKPFLRSYWKTSELSWLDETLLSDESLSPSRGAWSEREACKCEEE
ncbi:MAG: hypothetical protein JF606_12410 [Burkholderiales bacterium]|nr:hypothetical protein [Burkholderiales bacterium]